MIGLTSLHQPRYSSSFALDLEMAQVERRRIYGRRSTGDQVDWKLPLPMVVPDELPARDRSQSLETEIDDRIFTLRRTIELISADLVL